MVDVLLFLEDNSILDKVELSPGCNVCKASDSWLGRSSPVDHIRNRKLWLSQYLIAEGITEQDKEDIMHAIIKTKDKSMNAV